jgi:hypothetical protein
LLGLREERKSELRQGSSRIHDLILVEYIEPYGPGPVQHITDRPQLALVECALPQMEEVAAL